MASWETFIDCFDEFVTDVSGNVGAVWGVVPRYISISAALLLRGIWIVMQVVFDSASWYSSVLASNDSLLHEIFDSRRLIVSGILRRRDGGC